MLPTDVLVEWLDLKAPSWFSLASGCCLGILGILALSFLVVLFTPGSLAFWMPALLLFAAASAGYSFRQKQAPQLRTKGRSTLLAAAVGLVVALAGAAIQMGVDHYLFHAKTGSVFLAVFVLCGPLGALLGAGLRGRYEKLLKHPKQTTHAAKH